MSNLLTLWRSRGVVPGSALMLHASAKRTLQTHGGSPRSLLVSFIDAVGEEGTLLIPAFTWAWCRGVPFDIRTSPAEGMGVLCAEAMRWPGAVRTRHPIYNFMVIGAGAAEFRDGTEPTTYDNIDALGHGGPWSWLCSKSGKIGVLDLPDQNSMTAYHWVENVRGAYWRYFKKWTNDYTDANGVTSRKTYGMPVRMFDTRTNVNPAGEILWERGLYKGDRPGVASGLRTIDALAFYDIVGQMVDAIRQGSLSHKILYVRHEEEMSGDMPADMANAG